MQFSTLIIAALASSSAVSALPQLFSRQSSVTVSTDTGTAQVDVPATDAGGSNTGGRADAAGAIADVISKVVNLVQGVVDGDLARRRVFTQNVAARTQVATGKNVIVSNVGYTLDNPTGETVVGTSYNAKLGSDVTFDVIAFDTGSFTLRGDGGFENWAYVVSSSCNVNGKSITC